MILPTLYLENKGLPGTLDKMSTHSELKAVVFAFSLAKH